MANDAPGMKGYRPRDINGELRKKRSDTHMGTIEARYGKDFHVRADMHLGKFLEMYKRKSLDDLINQ